MNQCLIAFALEFQKLCVDATQLQRIRRHKVTLVGRNSANDIKLLEYLCRVLEVDALTPRTCAAMASGVVKAGGRGMYQLGTPNTFEPNTNTKDIALKAISVSAFTPYEVPCMAASLVPSN